MSVNLNLFNLLSTIESFKEKLETKEDYTRDEKNAAIPLAILGLILFISLSLFLYTIILLIVKWKYMPQWAKVLSIFSIFVGGPFITIMIVYASTPGKGKDTPGVQGVNTPTLNE